MLPDLLSSSSSKKVECDLRSILGCTRVLHLVPSHLLYILIRFL